MDTSTVLIGVDWGGSNLRAFAIDAQGRAGAQSEIACPALSLAAGGHAAVLDRLIADWRRPGLPVLVCGMAGARNGWQEVAYCPCPADASALAAGLLPVATDIWLVPGVRYDAGTGVEVMRGEETQALGAVAAVDDIMLICPGTHSKWIHVENGQIRSFRSSITGELFDALWSRWLPLAGTAPAQTDWAAFERGLAAGRATPLLSALFSVRAGYATAGLRADEIHDYLSGLLIGAELAACDDMAAGRPRRIVGAAALSARYAHALALGGHRATRLDAAACVAQGLSSIWQRRR